MVDEAKREHHSERTPSTRIEIVVAKLRMLGTIQTTPRGFGSFYSETPARSFTSLSDDDSPGHPGLNCADEGERERRRREESN
mmetsp:Transcript_23487/g.51013  ORF Transcript_23487/g.51013 Transcript_23487/m.51013 type:complete len:83 (+) Transcript_23487:447-695(+)